MKATYTSSVRHFVEALVPSDRRPPLIHGAGAYQGYGYDPGMADYVFPRTIAGREIQFHPPTDAQTLMIGRLMRQSRQFAEAENPQDLDEVTLRVGVEKFSMVLDIIDSMIVNPIDRDWIESKIVDGSLDMTELMDALKGDDEDDVPEPANRAQKRVAAKKATANARKR